MLALASLANWAAAQHTLGSAQDIDVMGPVAQVRAETNAQKQRAEHERIARVATVGKGDENICEKALHALIAKNEGAAIGEGSFDPTTGRFSIRIVERRINMGFGHDDKVTAEFFEFRYEGDRDSKKISPRTVKTYRARGRVWHEDGFQRIEYTQGSIPIPVLFNSRCALTHPIDS